MRICSILAGTALAIALAAATSGAATAQSAPTAAIAGKSYEVDGTLELRVLLQVDRNFPEGTMLSISAYASAADATYNDEVGADVQAKVTNHTATTTITLPYLWLVAIPDDKVTITASVYGSVTGVSEFSAFTSLGTVIKMPKNGATTVVPLRSAL